MVFDLNWIHTAFPDLRVVETKTAGGQKEVFVCSDANGTRVILKLFHPSNVELERVLREVRAPQECGACRVPRVIDSGQRPSSTGDVIYVVEELVEGESLRERLANGPLSATESMNLAVAILEILCEMEKVPIVHRDIKPENIMVAVDDSFWLLDFGIARFINLSSVTATAQPFGPATPGYAPPEQARNIKDEIDVRADLFALGVTVYESVTGSNPFLAVGGSPIEVLLRPEKMQLPRLDASMGMPVLFLDLIEAMTRSRRVQRPRSAAECLRWAHDSVRQAASGNP